MQEADSRKCFDGENSLPASGTRPSQPAWRLCTMLAVLAVTVAAAPVPAGAEEEGPRACLLPNGEPIVGVYYYPWFGGEPYGRVGWHPEFQFDNQRRPDHIREVLRAMADHGINQASYSYWGDGSLALFAVHVQQAEQLAPQGWQVYMSPYMEPPTIRKEFAEAEAQQFNIDRLSHFLEATGKSPAFCRLGGEPFTNIYVTYYRPTETDAQFREFLRGKYGSIERLRRAWAMEDVPAPLRAGAVPRRQLPARWEEVTLKAAAPGTVAFADRQELRAQRLREGWRAVLEGIRKRTGLTTRYTGDNSNTIVSPVRYMEAMGGLTWYSFGYPLNNPTRRPKLISEIAKYTDAVFLYTIAPGYVDRQQRWQGARVERDPFLYEYAWVKALQTLPEGIMLLTHSEWFEGTIIDVTKEFGRRPYETTELFASVFKATFADAFAHKRKKKPVAVVFNEWATYCLYDRGHNLGDVYGLIKALECLSVDFDVIPESALSEDELAGRRLIIVPSCGEGLHPEKVRLLTDWAQEVNGAHVIADATAAWRTARRGVGGNKIILAGERLGDRLSAAFAEAWSKGQVPLDQLRYVERLLLKALKPGEIWPEAERPSSSYEIARGPVVWVGNTAVVTLANTIPWGYITEHRTVGGGIGRGHSAENTRPWKRQEVTVSVKLPDGARLAQVQMIDSDRGRLAAPIRAGQGGEVEYDAGKNVVRIRARCKFYSVWAVVTGPVAMQARAFRIYPGGSSVASVTLTNLTRRAVRGKLEVVGPPGLEAGSVDVTVAPAASKQVAVQLRASSDCAVGTRTVRLRLVGGGVDETWWVPLRVTPPALLGLKTGVVAVGEGRRRIGLALANVGEQTARDVEVQFLGAAGRVGSLRAGQTTIVPLTVKPPELASASTPLPVQVSWEAGGPRDTGMQVLNGADGIIRRREAGGKVGVEPDPAKPANNRYIYFRIDKNRLPPGDYAAEAVVEYYDGTGSFIIEYDSALGDDIPQRYWDSAPVVLTGTGQWKEAIIELPRAHFAGRQNIGADLRISGRVLVRRVALRALEPKGRVVVEAARLRWKCGDGMFETTVPVRVAVQTEPGSAAGGPAGAVPIWVANPYGTAVPEVPVVVPAEDLPARLQDKDIEFVDWRGKVWPAIRSGRRFMAVLPADPLHPLYARPATGPESDLKLRDRSGDLGYIAAENTYLGVLWDARRGGCLMCLQDVTNRREYASPTSGACTVEYTLADRRHEVSSAWPGEVSIAVRSPIHAEVVAQAQGPHVTVEDRWRVYAGARFLRLDRTVAFTRELAAVDFCPLVLRLSPEHFAMVLPLGVGFEKAGVKRGWLESWHSEGWYFAYRGDRNAATDAVALIVSQVDGLRRIRYGFIPAEYQPEAFDPRAVYSPRDELQIRLRATAKYTLGLGWLEEGLRVPAWWAPRGERVYKPGDKIVVRAIIAIPRFCSWRYARELALMNKYGTAAAVGEEPPLGGAQIPELRRPAYMYRVHPPAPSAELRGTRRPGFAPEVAGIEQ